MWFWWFMLICDLIVPVVMVIGGRMMWKHCPKHINGMSGYRTTRSMKNMDTWKFAHDYCGKLWWKTGWIMMIPSALIHIPLYHRDKNTIGFAGVILVTIQCIIMIASIYPTEKALKKYFNDDGTYDPSQHKTRIAFTFDDGPGEYTDQLLDCLEQNNAHATFFMLGQNVENWQSEVQRMVDIGCEIGSHSWDHLNLYDLDMDAVAKEFSDTDAALEKACGQKASVARAPYGNWSDDIIATVQKPFFTWSLDSLDWSYMDVDKDYNEIMNGDLTDGSIILMHDIHEPSVQAAIKMIPELVQKGYKLMTVSELAAAKGVTLQGANYSDFWDSSLQKGIVAGYSGNTTDTSGDESTDGTDTSNDGSTDTSDGSSDDGSADDESSDDGSYDDGSSDDGYSDDSSYDDGSYDEGDYSE